MGYDHEAVGFTVDWVGRGPRAHGAVRLEGHEGSSQLAVSDPSGAGHRWTVDEDDEPVCDEPLLRAGPVTQLRVRDAVLDVRCPWCSVLLADVDGPDGPTGVAVTVTELASTMPAWTPETPVPAWLSLWPHTVQASSTRERFDAGPGRSAPLGTWESTTADGLLEVLTTVAGTVVAVQEHVNAHTGATFGVVELDPGPHRPSLVVPFTADDLAVTRVAPGHLLVVQGRLRAAYAGPPSRTVLPPGLVPWPALRLGLVGTPQQAPPPAPPPPPPEVHDGCFVPEGRTPPAGRVLCDDVQVGAPAAPGAGVCVVGDTTTPVLTGWTVHGETWELPLPALATWLRTGDGLVLALSGGWLDVVDAAGGEVLLRARMTDPPTSWVVSRQGLWALRGEPGRADRRWSLLRLPRHRWNTDGARFLDVCETTDLPDASGIGPGYHRAGLEPGDTSRAGVVAVVPDDDRPGLLLKAGAEGPPQVFRPSAEQLPLGVLATPAGELVTTRQGVWFGGRPVEDLMLPLQRWTRWWVLDHTTLGGEVVPAYEHADEMQPSRLGVLRLLPQGPVWTEVERAHYLNDVRWVLDPHSPQTAWWSSCSPAGTRVGRLELPTGRTSRTEIGATAALLAADSRHGSAALVVRGETQRVYSAGYVHQATAVAPSSVHVVGVESP